MATINQLKEHYSKDLLSYRQLASYLYKSVRQSRGYVIGLAEASEIVDNGFWNNENLFAQFDVKNQKSSGSQFFDGIIDAVKDNEVEKLINKASEESTGKLVFYVPEGNNRIMADMIFFNKSKNRVLDDATMVLGGIPVKMALKTKSARLGEKTYEDVITFDVGDFSFFKESVNGNELELYFNTEKDEEDEVKDFLSLKFEINIPVVDIASVDYIVNGSHWEENNKAVLPAIEKGLELSGEQSRLDGMGADIIKVRKKAKRTSWIIATVLLFAAISAFPDMPGGVSLLLIVGFVLLGMSGKKYGNKKTMEKENSLKESLSKLSDRKEELNTQINNCYTATSDTVISTE